MQTKETHHARLAIGPIERAKPAGFIRNDQCIADRVDWEEAAEAPVADGESPPDERIRLDTDVETTLS